MTTGRSFGLGVVRNGFLLRSELPDAWVSGVGDGDKAVFMAVYVMVCFTFVLLFLFGGTGSEVLSSAISSRFGGSEEAVADDSCFHAPCLATLVPPWEQCTFATTVTF